MLETDFAFDDALFAGLEIDLLAAEPARYIKPPRTRQIPEQYLRYADAVALARDIDVQPLAPVYCVVAGSFIFGDFIEALITEKGWRAKELLISTLAMSENNVDSLGNLLLGGHVDSIDLIVSDWFFAHERRNLIPYLYEELDQGNRFQLAVAGSHCKVCIFETYCGRHIVIHGSANLRSSGCMEQFMIEDNPALYAMNWEVQTRILDTYKTINKAVRHKRLWQAVQQDKAGAAGAQPGEDGQAPPKGAAH